LGSISQKIISERRTDILLNMRRMFCASIAKVLLACLSVAAVQLSAQVKKDAAKAAEVKNPVPSTPQSIAAGKALFQKYCRFCHGDGAKGNGPQAPEGTHPPDLTDAKWDHGAADSDIFAVIKDGVGPKFDMKGYTSKMTPQEIWSTVNYLRSLGPHGTSQH
jgi:mono/diheme cytochrome c family protein